MSRRLMSPVVVQAAAMDCGPSALRSLLLGHRIDVPYEALRRACGTNVDGSSVDVLEAVAADAGLVVRQLLLPSSHLLSPARQHLPALIVTRRPDGGAHVVVAWRRWGRWFELMDPARGRRWLDAAWLWRELHLHRQEVSEAAWLAWAGGAEAMALTRARLRRLEASEALADGAAAAGTWEEMGRLDALLAEAEALLAGRVFLAARQAGRWLAGRWQDGAEPARQHWSVEAGPEVGTLIMTGAVCLEARGLTAPGEVRDAASPGGAAAGRRGFASVLGLLGLEGWGLPLVLGGMSVIAAGAVLLEALLFRALIGAPVVLADGQSRFLAVAALLVLALLIVGLEVPRAGLALRLGRAIELRLRAALMTKLARVDPAYVESRPRSDLAERCHGLPRVRTVPDLGQQLLFVLASLCFTSLGLVWLAPALWPLIGVTAVWCAALPLAALPGLVERELTVRAFAGGLVQRLLDGLLGLEACAAAGGARILEAQYESLLTGWARAGLALQGRHAIASAATVAGGLAGAVGLVATHVSMGADPDRILLLGYWALSLPLLGRQLGRVLRQVPAYRSAVLRLQEPLDAPERSPCAVRGLPVTGGLAIEIDRVTATVGEAAVLVDLSLSVEPGEHVAIVGPSGSGKSTLLGLLLGRVKAARGRVLVGGRPLDEEGRAGLAAVTAWSDGDVRLWNRPLLENVAYGSTPGGATPARALAELGLGSTVERLPAGLATSIGEGGTLLSGGEGQRVRLARAWAREEPRLVLLDEALRGLDGPARQALTARLRKRWRRATMLVVTHDLEATLGFDRVIVLERGRCREVDVPARLAARPGSRYGELLAAEAQWRIEAGPEGGWRELMLEDGRVAGERGERRRAPSVGVPT